MNNDDELVCLREDYWQMLYALLRAEARLKDIADPKYKTRVTTSVAMTPPGRDSDEIMVGRPAGRHVFILAHQGIRYLELSSNEEKFIPFGKFPELLKIIRQIFQ